MTLLRSSLSHALAMTILGTVGLGPALAAPSPAIPPEVAAHIPRNVEPYYIAFLVSPAEAEEMPFDLFVRHQAYLRRQFEAGVYRLAGPMMDEGRFRGTLILSAASAEQARAIVEADPAVREGVFSVEVHPAMFPSLATLRVEYPARD